MPDEKQTLSTPETKPQEPQGAGEKTPDNQGQGEETVTLAKKEAEELQALKARQSELTKREQKLKAREQRFTDKSKKSDKSHTSFSFEEPEEPEEPTELELQNQIAREQLNVERGVLKIVKSGDFNKLLENDPTLGEILLNNPMGLPVFGNYTPRDAEDALDKIEDYLAEKTSNIPNAPEKEAEEPVTPKTGPTNPKTELPVKPVEPTGPKTVDEVGENLVRRILG